MLALGHQVTPLQENVTSNEEAIALIKDVQPDIVFYSHSHGWPILDGMLDWCTENGIPTAAYHLDLFMGLEDDRRIRANYGYWKVQNFYTVDKLMADTLNEDPALPRGIFLPPGVVATGAYLGEPYSGLTEDVIFVGSRGYHINWPWRPQLIDWLAATYGTKFSHYGGDGVKLVRNSELNRLLASTKIVVGDSLCPVTVCLRLRAGVALSSTHTSRALKPGLSWKATRRSW